MLMFLMPTGYKGALFVVVLRLRSRKHNIPVGGTCVALRSILYGLVYIVSRSYLEYL